MRVVACSASQEQPSSWERRKPRCLSSRSRRASRLPALPRKSRRDGVVWQAGASVFVGAAQAAMPFVQIAQSIAPSGAPTEKQRATALPGRQERPSSWSGASRDAFRPHRAQHRAFRRSHEDSRSCARREACAGVCRRAPPHCFCFFVNSMRRFFARPSAVALSAIGLSAPCPTAVRRSPATPLPIR